MRPRQGAGTRFDLYRAVSAACLFYERAAPSLASDDQSLRNGTLCCKSIPDTCADITCEFLLLANLCLQAANQTYFLKSLEAWQDVGSSTLLTKGVTLSQNQ